MPPETESDIRWGVDVGARSAYICSLTNRAVPHFAEVTVPRYELGANLAALHRATAIRVHDLLDHGHTPSVVVVEQPSGMHRNLPLTYAAGVIIAAITHAIADHTGFVPLVTTAPPSQWKKQTLGNGNISAPHYLERAQEILPDQHALTHDLAAAYWIARFAFLLPTR